MEAALATQEIPVESPEPNYFKKCRERLEQANVDWRTVCDILDLMELQYKLGVTNASKIYKGVYKLKS